MGFTFDGFRLIIEPPSTFSWIFGGLLMLVGLVLPASLFVYRKKSFLFGGGVDVNKLV